MRRWRPTDCHKYREHCFGKKESRGFGFNRPGVEIIMGPERNFNEFLWWRLVSILKQKQHADAPMVAGRLSTNVANIVCGRSAIIKKNVVVVGAHCDFNTRPVDVKPRASRLPQNYFRDICG